MGRKLPRAVIWSSVHAVSRRNIDAIAGLWAHGNAALGAGLRLRRGGWIYGTRRSCRPGAYHRAGDRRRRELLRHRRAVRQWRIGKEPWPRFAKAETSQRGRRQHAQSICRRGIADELSGTRLWTIVRSHQGSRRWSSGYPRASRRRTVGFSRASPDCWSGARADWFGYELRCRCRSRTPSNPAGKGGFRHQPDRSRHAVCAVSPGDGHYPGRYGDAATVRGRTRRGPKRPTTASRARPAVSTAAGILRRTTRIAEVAHASTAGHS